jgi:hypothetical protein
VVGGERKTGARGWGPADEGLHAVGARQHQSLNLLLRSKRCKNLKKESSLTERSGNVCENKGLAFGSPDPSGHFYENTVLTR